MPFDTKVAARSRTSPTSPFAIFDRTVHGSIAELTSAMSPVVAAQAWLDWYAHLSISPGKQVELLMQASDETLRLASRILVDHTPTQQQKDRRLDRRFEADDWKAWPFNVLHLAHLASERWWQNATSGIRGVSRRSEMLVRFGAQQSLHALSPANFLATNPELWRATFEQGGRNLLRGARNLATDIFHAATGNRPVDEEFVVGKNLALTPGRVIFRNQLVELIQYEPTTPTTRPEPVLIVPAWIMKYYILDLQPHNSMIKFLVDHGHTVFAISWRNPTAEHRDLGMDDYLQSGVMAALDVISRLMPNRKVHACGYCLGGTMLSIAAAAMARDGDDRLASVTMLAAQTDFTEPGEIALFIDDTAIAWLDGAMALWGFLDGSRMGGSFQMLRVDDLIWKPFVRRYVLGETDRPNDLMSWNADQTRMPYRMHTEYLRNLYLHNQIAQGRFVVANRPIALSDIEVPIYCLGTAQDHVAPWRSVFKLHLLARSDLTFVLTSGGHNAGVISEPGHPGRTYQKLVRPHDGRYVDPDTWVSTASHHEGSWWVDWGRWLDDHSGELIAPPSLADAVCTAPGAYVLER